MWIMLDQEQGPNWSQITIKQNEEQWFHACLAGYNRILG